eukprot:CAMPEP_0115725322 /NCGR_PEP_ID=MMETSP0272-20121206/81252_1 /TAXON_ID=71861 /ORGANISM="Scrippsiella trochoidea, Strain CCMP3099" /LENGTH=48 /DNA_ID= /DNA_START= /DNA_END= /DNA_ORIENTATION=
MKQRHQKRGNVAHWQSTAAACRAAKHRLLPLLVTKLTRASVRACKCAR